MAAAPLRPTGQAPVDFAPFRCPVTSFSKLAFGMSGGCGYTLAIMNDAIKPGPETRRRPVCL